MIDDRNQKTKYPNGVTSLGWGIAPALCCLCLGVPTGRPKV